MKKYLVLGVLVLAPFFVSAAPIGFVKDSVWLSNDAPNEGDTVTISTLVVNGDQSTLTAKVQFYDSELLLSEKSVSVDKGDAKIVTTSWKVTAGSHALHAALKDATLVSTSGKKTSVTLSDAQSANQNLFVKTSTPTSLTEQNKVDAKVNEVASKVESVVPEAVKDTFASTGTSVEGLRETWELSLTDKQNQEKAKLAEMDKVEQERLKAKADPDPANYVANNYVDSAGGNVLQKPFSYILIFLYSLFLFIVGNQFVFYGVIALVVFVIVRSIFRSFRK